MASVARGETIDCSNPKLDVFTKVNEVRVDVSALSYRILDPDGAEVVAATSVNVVDDCPTGNRLAIGRYIITPWTVPPAAVIDTWAIEWTITLSPGVPPTVFTEDFEVVSVSGLSSDGYTTVADIRLEGVPTTTADDARLQKLITRASRLLDKLTGQWFEPRSLTMTVDGQGSKRLAFKVPICEITEISVDGTVVSPDTYRVYNRHLTQSLTAPDDRSDPRVEYRLDRAYGYDDGSIYQRHPTGRWARGEQNVTVVGTFGYTEPPGPPGQIPTLIARATELLVMRDIARLCEPDDRWDARFRNRIQSIRTRDQSQSVAARRASTGLTGDEEIDEIITMYMAPITIGST